MYDFLEKDLDNNFEYLNEDEYTLLNENQIKTQKSGLIFCGYRNKKIRTNGTRKGTEHLSRVHKQPNRIYSAKGIHPTISSQEYSGRYFIYVDGKVRKLTLNECFRFMGYPDSFKKIGSNAQLYARVGNSICVPMVKSIAKELKNQFWGDKEDTMDVNEFLENTYYEKKGFLCAMKESGWLTRSLQKQKFKGTTS